MASPQEKNIASYFQSESKGNGKGKKPTQNSQTAAAPTSSKVKQPEPQTKAKEKRPLSSPPPAPAAKRSNTATSSAPQRKHYAYNDLASDWNDKPKEPTEKGDADPPKKLQITHHKGDMFKDAPINCLLIHACNTQGHWGAGIAKLFRSKYPKAYAAHHAYCAKEHSPTTNPVPCGTSQLLAPVDATHKHWIGCVFTSARYGKKKDKPAEILKSTKTAMEMVLELVKCVDESEEEADKVSTIRMCRINSGMFGVPWVDTEEVLTGIVLREGWRGEIEVWEY
ncbi:hypothetical protein FB567DRAFT_316729 [Paraphoma chrysanthemicola]|uniref:ADP-ribose 1''-phosphate phosphatase n=1 Tax=Paraphoma chrysanthemicola TaxID=798071 RepID=A0A8K0R8V0_9PLEO|nr:hypothetical protein FB567DRAFT_316729 [Paraphoma chrysanthemicola]